MEERRSKSGMNESAKRQKGSSEGRAQAAQRTSSRPTSRDAYNKQRVQGTKLLCWRLSRVHDGYIVTSRKPHLAGSSVEGFTCE